MVLSRLSHTETTEILKRFFNVKEKDFQVWRVFLS